MKSLFSLLVAGLLGFLSCQAQVSRFSFYTENEQVAEIILPQESGDSLVLKYGEKSLYASRVRYALGGAEMIAFPLSSLPDGDTEVNLICFRKGEAFNSFPLRITRLAEKPHAVRLDRLTGGMIVDGLPYFPFGFYCYSPVQPTLAEEEVVKGFNMMSPYQRIADSTMEARKAYMDRCAALGMKVHYQLLSVSGGGGGGSARANYEAEEKLRLLRKEVETFKDHPALLAWYISDEPTGHGMPPDPLEKTYDFIRSLDPYHPITIVFMNPPKAREYAAAMDIVMADPYPIPNRPAVEAGEVIAGLKQEFGYEMPVWVVPQAFGGAEWWAREPTAAELRMMTYHSLIEGATGVQYFVRHGLSAFPKSTDAWNECGAMAREIAELAPVILGSPLFEHSPKVRTDHAAIKARAWYKDHEKLVVMVVNTENQPRSFRIILDEAFSMKETTAKVLFESREMKGENGVITDIIDRLGTRVYEIGWDTFVPVPEEAKVLPRNLMVNPSFEDNPSVGTPAGCYFGVKEDRGATAMVDPRLSHSGEHSVRLVTPRDSQGLVLSFFPAPINPGANYLLEIWAKAAPGTTPRLAMGLSDFGNDTVTLSDSWQPYHLPLKIPSSSNGLLRRGPSVSLLDKGTAWIDDKSLWLDPEITINENREVEISTARQGVDIRYTLNGTEPTKDDFLYVGSFLPDKTSEVVASVFVEGKPVASNRRLVPVHLALGREVTYLTAYSDRYPGQGAKTLVDGQVGGTNFREPGIWQAWLTTDMEVVIDLDEVKKLKEVSARFLQWVPSHIFLPTSVRYELSVDGKTFTLAGEVNNSHELMEAGPLIEPFSLKLRGKKARYVKVNAKGLAGYPEGYPASGSKVWLFADEVMIR